MTSIYVLRLLNGKFYVGKTTNLMKRTKSHFNMKGSAWTKKHSPLEIMKVYHNCDKFDEDKYTKMYMNKYGIENVRGGSFSSINLNKEEIYFIKKSLMTANDNCYICGQKGHFAKNCKYKI